MMLARDGYNKKANSTIKIPFQIWLYARMVKKGLPYLAYYKYLFPSDLIVMIVPSLLGGMKTEWNDEAENLPDYQEHITSANGVLLVAKK